MLCIALSLHKKVSNGNRFIHKYRCHLSGLTVYCIAPIDQWDGTYHIRGTSELLVIIPLMPFQPVETKAIFAQSSVHPQVYVKL